MRGNETPGRIVTIFCTGVGVHDVITSANFYDCCLVWAWWGSNVGFSIDSRRHPYNTLALPCECVMIKVCVYVYVHSRSISFLSWCLTQSGVDDSCQPVRLWCQYEQTVATPCLRQLWSFRSRLKTWLFELTLAWHWPHSPAALHFVFYFNNSVKCPCNVIHDSVTLIFTFLITIIINVLAYAKAKWAKMKFCLFVFIHFHAYKQDRVLVFGAPNPVRGELNFNPCLKKWIFFYK